MIAYISKDLLDRLEETAILLTSRSAWIFFARATHRRRATFSIPRVCMTPPQMSTKEVLSAFHRDAPYLFLGAAFVAVGFVSAAFAAIRRKHDSLLIYFCYLQLSTAYDSGFTRPCLESRC